MKSFITLRKGAVGNSLLQYNNQRFNFHRLLTLFLFVFYLTPAHTADKYQYEYFEGQHGYFKELIFGRYANNNDNRVWKWVDDVNIFVKGEMPTLLSKELDKIIAELNHISGPIHLARVASEDQANYFMFFESGETYLLFEPNVPSQWVEKGGAHYLNKNTDYEIYNGSMYIDLAIVKDNTYRKYWLRKLLSHSLGIRYQAPKYADSVFSSLTYREITLRYSNLDKTIIKKLYSKCVKAGMDKYELDDVLVNGC